MFSVEAHKVSELVMLIVGTVIIAITIVVAAIAIKMSDKPDNIEKDTDNISVENNMYSDDIDWGYVCHKQDYVNAKGDEVYLLTYKQAINDKVLKRTDRVTQSTYDKFTIGDKFYRATYTEDGIRIYEGLEESKESEQSEKSEHWCLSM